MDLKPLVSDHGIGRRETERLTQPERDRKARLIRLQEELEAQERMRFPDNLVKEDHARAQDIMIYSSAFTLLGLVPFTFNEHLAGYTGGAGVAATLVTAFGAGMWSMWQTPRRFADSARAEIRIPILRDEIRRLSAVRRAPSLVRQAFEESTTAPLRLYRPSDPELLGYWNRHRDAMIGGEDNKILSLFQRAEQVLTTPHERMKLVRLLEMSKSGSLKSEYDEAYERGDAYLSGIEARKFQTVKALPLDELIRKSRYRLRLFDSWRPAGSRQRDGGE